MGKGDVAKHSSMPRTAHPSEDYLVPNVNNPEAEKPELKSPLSNSLKFYLIFNPSGLELLG